LKNSPPRPTSSSALTPASTATHPGSFSSAATAPQTPIDLTCPPHHRTCHRACL